MKLITKLIDNNISHINHVKETYLFCYQVWIKIKYAVTETVIIEPDNNLPLIM